MNVIFRTLFWTASAALPLFALFVACSSASDGDPTVDGGAMDAAHDCKPKVFSPDASHPCREYVYVPCGVVPGTPTSQSCCLPTDTCNEICGSNPFYCRAAPGWCDDAGGIRRDENGGSNIECEVCAGGGGCSP